MNIFDKVRYGSAREFYEGIDKTPYEYSNKPLATCIKAKGSFDALIANASEIIGRALLAEMNEKGEPLNQNIYNNVKQKFFKLSTDNNEYIDVADTYFHAGDKAICKYLIATWKHGEELGHAIGLNDEQISTIKNAVKDTYMPQENGHQTRTNGREMQNEK